MQSDDDTVFPFRRCTIRGAGGRRNRNGWLSHAGTDDREFVEAVDRFAVGSGDASQQQDTEQWIIERPGVVAWN